jgi:hypothetical protein
VEKRERIIVFSRKILFKRMTICILHEVTSENDLVGWLFVSAKNKISPGACVVFGVVTLYSACNNPKRLGF